MRSLKFARLLLPVALLALLALPAGAQTKADFSDKTRPLTTNYSAAIGAPLTNGGFDFYNANELNNPTVAASNNAFTIWGTNDPSTINRPRNLNGANAIFTDGLGSRIDIVKAGSVDAGFPFVPLSALPSFGLASIDFAHVYSDIYARGVFALMPITLDIIGINSVGDQFFQTFVFPVAAPDANGVRTPVLTTAFLDSRFSNVTDVIFFQGTGSGRSFQFTNVTATPEPASLVLLGTGLLGVFGVTARRRRKDALIA